mgnify:FL=1
MAELVLCLEYLHEHGWVYRDLKPSNVMLDVEGHAHLVDFGLCKRVEKRMRRWSTGGSVEYLSPEVFESGKYDASVDWWSLGVVLWEMLSGGVPTNGVLEKPWYMSMGAFNVCYRLMERDARRRLGACGSDEVKRHPFFVSVDWEAMRERRVKPPFVVQSGCDEVSDSLNEVNNSLKQMTASLNENENEVTFPNYAFPSPVSSQTHQFIRPVQCFDPHKHTNSLSSYWNL